MDKQKPTASDLETEEARRLAKSEAGLANVRARSERERKLASSQQSPFQGISTAKSIIPNKKIGRGYDPFALPIEKHRTSALTNWLKKDRWYITPFKKKAPQCSSLWYWTFRTPLEWFSDSTTSRKSSSGTTYQTTSLVHDQIPGLSELGARCKRFRKKASWGAWDLYGGVVPSFCQTNKIWGIHVDDIYAPMNYKNSHWLVIWISIPKRHIVIWENIVGCIRQAQLDQSFTYEIVNAPQCESGDCGHFALKYIECHALGFPFPGSLNPKNSKAIREKMAVDIFEEIPDAHQTEITDVDVNQGMYD
ncbi:hypothetical protein N665_0837s0005 [Sinapis alba]|nr:hypothetical protein N665_0837s0005 [Sinapis alba]